MITVTIDNMQVTTEPGVKIIELAENLGIYIPRFCYHKKLAVIGSCRICLVEIIGKDKLVTACSTVIEDKMQILTNSPKVQESRQAILELLLINHPLECPVCEKSGECTLQDLVMEYGIYNSVYKEKKRVIARWDLNKDIIMEPSRCIYCMRCVRFCDDIAGSKDLIVVGSGENIQIKANKDAIYNGVTGNITELCEVGGSIAKTGAGFASNLELSCSNGISPYDCVGSNLAIYTARNRIIRINALENNEINECWIGDKDRFGFVDFQKGRLNTPLVKHKNNWQPIGWNDAFELVRKQFTKIVIEHSPKELGALVNTTATLEEMYMLQKYLRNFGSNNIDHRINQHDFNKQADLPVYPSLGVSLPELEQQQLLLLLGTDITNNQPILNIRLNKMNKNGSKIITIKYEDALFEQLLGISKILLNKHKKTINNSKLQELIMQCTPSMESQNIAENLANNNIKDKLLLLGEKPLDDPQASIIYSLFVFIADLTNAKYGVLTAGPNAAGAWVSGCIPHRLANGKELPTNVIGKNAYEMLNVSLKGYLLYGFTDQLLDNKAIANSVFTVACTWQKTESLMTIADLLLPIAAFPEVAGTFINITGTWQEFPLALQPLEYSMQGWELLNNLGEFDYKNRASILQELKACNLS